MPPAKPPAPAPISRVWIEPGCIVCYACEVQCAEVFDVREDGCVVRTKKFKGLESRIHQAAADCPVKVIEYSTTPTAAPRKAATSRKSRR